MKFLVGLLVVALGISAFAGSPKPFPVNLTIDPYIVPPNLSNAVIVIYRSTSLGSVASPYKPCGIFPASRFKFTVTQLSGTTCYYRAAVRSSNFGESLVSNTTTNKIK